VGLRLRFPRQPHGQRGVRFLHDAPRPLRSAGRRRWRWRGGGCQHTRVELRMRLPRQPALGDALRVLHVGEGPSFRLTWQPLPGSWHTPLLSSLARIPVPRNFFFSLVAESDSVERKRARQQERCEGGQRLNIRTTERLLRHDTMNQCNPPRAAVNFGLSVLATITATRFLSLHSHRWPWRRSQFHAYVGDAQGDRRGGHREIP
jgi:hypothetical protein